MSSKYGLTDNADELLRQMAAAPKSAEDEANYSNGAYAAVDVVRWLDAAGVRAPERSRSANRSLLIETAEEIEAIYERAEELADWAIDEGYPAIGHKLEEACGPLNSAASAARQYDDGTLKAVGL